jgi:hypothetical protein
VVTAQNTAAHLVVHQRQHSAKSTRHRQRHCDKSCQCASCFQHLLTVPTDLAALLRTYDARGAHKVIAAAWVRPCCCCPAVGCRPGSICCDLLLLLLLRPWAGPCCAPAPPSGLRGGCRCCCWLRHGHQQLVHYVTIGGLPANTYCSLFGLDESDKGCWGWLGVVCGVWFFSQRIDVVSTAGWTCHARCCCCPAGCCY